MGSGFLASLRSTINTGVRTQGWGSRGPMIGSCEKLFVYLIERSRGVTSRFRIIDIFGLRRLRQ